MPRGLGTAAISAVERLAAAAGHPLQVGAISTRATGSTVDYGALVALAVGVALIVASWSLSLRAHPLGSGVHSRR
jgi:hypothetical protein